MVNGFRKMDSFAIKVIDIQEEKFLNRCDFYKRIRLISSIGYYDILITYRCRYLIPMDICMNFKVCFNIHPTKLPELAGMNPWEKVKASGIKESCVTMHILSELPDKGRIIATEPYSFCNFSDAREKSDEAAAVMISKYFYGFDMALLFSSQK